MVAGSIPDRELGADQPHSKLYLALVAQWIEHSPSKRGVAGSNPARGVASNKKTYL